MRNNKRRNKKLLRRGWFWAALSVALLIIIVILSANYIIGIVIEQSLMSNGAREASTGQIRFNPFAGSLSIDSLNVMQQDIVSLDIGNIHVRFRLLSLFQRNIEIKEVIIRNAHIGFTVQSEEQNLLGGLSLPTPRREDGKDSSSNWNISLESVRMVQSHIRVNYDDDATNIGIDKAEISGLNSWNEIGELRLDLHATINESLFRINMTVQSRNSDTRLAGHVKIKALQIEQFINFIPVKAHSLSGKLHVDMDMELMLNTDGDFKLAENGMITMSGIYLKTDDIELESGDIKLQGEIVVNRFKDRLMELIIEGEANVSPVRLRLSEEDIDTGFTAMSWHGNARITGKEEEFETSIGGSTRVGGLYFTNDSLNSNFGVIHWKGDARIASPSETGLKPHVNGNLSFVEASLERIKPENSRIHIQNFTVPNVAVDDLSDITISGMEAAKLELFQNGDEPLFSIKKLWTGKINVYDFNRFKLEHIGLNDLSLQDENMTLDMKNATFREINLEEWKQISAAKVQMEGVEFESEGNKENALSCSIERIEADNTTFTDGKNLAVLVFALQSVDLQAGPHHLYLNSSHVRNAKMLGTESISLSLFEINSLVLLESTDKRVLKDVPSSFPLSLSKAQLMNIELKELKHLHLETALINGLTTIFRRSEDKPLSIGGIYSSPKDPTSKPKTTFSIDRLALQQNCTLIIIDETVEPRARFDMQFKHLDVRGIGSKDENIPINFSSKLSIGSYADIAAEGFIQRNTSPPELDISLLMNGFGLQELSPYAKKHMGYRIDRGKLYIDSDLSIKEGQIDSKNTIILKNTVIIPEDTEKSKEALSIYAKQLEKALTILSDKNNTLVLEIPVTGDINNPNFDLSKVVRTAVATAIRAAFKLTVGVALWPYSGFYVAADLASDAQATVELEPVYFDAGKSQLSERMKSYLNQVASFLYKHPKVDMSLCSVSTTADQKRFSNKERLNRLAEKRAKAVKEYLVETAGIDPNRLFLCRPEIDSSVEAPGYVDLQF